jgi:hypothetical protein
MAERYFSASTPKVVSEPSVQSVPATCSPLVAL